MERHRKKMIMKMNHKFFKTIQIINKMIRNQIKFLILINFLITTITPTFINFTIGTETQIEMNSKVIDNQTHSIHLMIQKISIFSFPNNKVEINKVHEYFLKTHILFKMDMGDYQIFIHNIIEILIIILIKILIINPNDMILNRILTKIHIKILTTHIHR